MSLDRFIRWKTKRPEWGDPTIEKLATVARDFLGPRWTVKISNECWITCETDDHMTFALRSEHDDLIEDGRNKGRPSGDVQHEAMQKQTRGFNVFFLVKNGKIDQTSVITRMADEYTGALADGYAAMIARWWNGEVESG